MDPAFAAAYPSRPAYSLDHGKPARFIGLALLWQIFIWALFDELFTVRASYLWGFRECVEDGLPDGWHGRLRGWSGDSFFPVPRP